MLDILHSQVPTSVAHDHDMACVSQAVHLSKAMEPSKRLEFLVLLSIKLEGGPFLSGLRSICDVHLLRLLPRMSYRLFIAKFGASRYSLHDQTPVFGDW